jgi:branched-subunit amino acid ABC-type transport system permease component
MTHITVSSFVDPLVTGLISGNTYALIALGLSLIFGSLNW